MATEYIAAATAETEGALFTLATGTSRVFYCDPPLGHGERCFLQITNDAGTTYFDVGDLCVTGRAVSTVSATGEGSTSFRVVKSETAASTAVWYD